MFKFLYLLIFCIASLKAEALYYPYELHNFISTKTVEKSYAKDINDSVGSSIEYKLSYQTINSAKYKKIASFLDRVVNDHLHKFNKTDPKKEVLTNLKELCYKDVQRYDTTIELFAITPNTVTICVKESSYTGGAHASYDQSYINYSLKDGKIVEFDEIFPPLVQDKFLEVLEKHYKFIKRIPPSESLAEYDGFFNNYFTLPDVEHFAITNEGIFLYYGIYELKPYSYGETFIFIPYSKLSSLISKNSAIKDLIKSKNHSHFNYLNRYAYIKIDTNQTDHVVKLDIKVTNLTKEKNAYLSLSTPQFYYTNIIKNYNKKNFDTIRFYPKGSFIYNIDERKNIPARYLLVELNSKNWEQNSTKNFQIEFKIPKRFEQFLFDIRFVSSVDPLHALPLYFDGYIGQQYFREFRESIKLK